MLEVRVHHLGHGVAAEGVLPRERIVEEAAERVEVRALVEGLSLRIARAP